MTFAIYHQLGNQYKWNLQCYLDDAVGHGFIFSPRHISPSKVETDFSVLERSISLFDPQFFLPKTDIGHLKDYPFFPSVISKDFETARYIHDYADDAAQMCVEYQRDKGFQYCVIPTRYVGGTPSRFISDYEAAFVTPFLRAIESVAPQQKVALQLILNQHMLMDARFRNNILNWVTNFDEVDAIYLIVEHSLRSKQIHDSDLLLAILMFIDALKFNELDVIVGYLNTESVILSLANPTILTIGSYEATRMFNIQRFEKKDDNSGGGGASPISRIYSPRLLQYIDHRDRHTVGNPLKDEDPPIFPSNQYSDDFERPGFKWGPHNKTVYKANFVNINQQLMSLRIVEDRERYDLVCDMIKDAQHLYSKLPAGIQLGEHSDGSHLRLWNNAVVQFAQWKGWI